MPSQPGTSASRPIRILAFSTVLLIGALVIMNMLIAGNLRESALTHAETSLERHSLTLAGQAERSFQSIDLILSNINDYLLSQGVTDSASYESLMGNEETYRLLRGKLAGLPQLEAITMINARGKLINFSRYWPIPDVNISDRDYYKALSQNSAATTYVGKPVQNRGTGTWNIYIARRVNGPTGEFTGLILAAISLEYFEEFYKSISLGEGSAESLLRDDGTLLARYPKTSEVGKVVASHGSLGLLQSSGGTVRELSPIDKTMRIKAAHKLAGLPLSILTTQTEESVLKDWRETVKLLMAFTGGMVGVLLLAATVIIRKWRQQEVLRRVQAEKAAAERDKTLAETALLRQQERSAEAANRAKSIFLAVMSHEIRTPMNAVLGLTSSLLDTHLTGDQRESVHAIHTAGDSLLEILNDILDFSKLEAGNLALESAPFSPAGVIDTTLSVVGASAAAKGLELRVALAPDLPGGVLGDGGKIRQVLLNLASNAIKFTPAGEIRIEVECLERDSNAARMRWTVTDTGIGIPADRIGALFNDFVQADSSVSRQFGGSGLGLAICRRLIEQMGGEIQVESELGRGSRFFFELALPLAELPAAGAQEDDTSIVLLRQRIEEGGRPMRILIVDDNQTNRMVASKMFAGFDVTIREAGDGREGVNAVFSEDFDLVFMDMRMPEMDGLTATRKIREAGGKFKHLPIIAFTANAFGDDREACAQAGMNDFVAKPVRKKFLMQAAIRALWECDLESMRAAGKIAEGAAAAAPSGWSEPAGFAEPVFDREPFAQLAAELDLDGAIETFKVFARDTRERLQAFSQIRIDTDRKRVQIEAHSLKSTAATFGFGRLAELARRLEQNAPDISEAEFLAIVPEMDEAFGAAMQDFETAFQAA